MPQTTRRSSRQLGQVIRPASMQWRRFGGQDEIWVRRRRAL